MVRSRVFGFLAITLCLVACLCARAAVSEEDAQDAVKDVKTLTDKALEKAQRLSGDAKGVKDTVEARKVKAEKAATEATAAAAGNEKAVTIANKAKSALDELLTIYPNAQDAAEKALESMNELLSKARGLVGKSNIPITPDGGSGDDYSKVSESAAAVTNEAQQLNTEITGAERLLSAASVEKFKVSQKAEKAQVAKHQVDAVVIIAKMETLLSEADADIVSIQQKSNEITAVVEAIKKHLENTPQDLIHRINGYLTNAEGDFRRVTSKMNEAQAAKQAMVNEKKNADDSLTGMLALTDENQVRTEFRNVEHFARRAAEELKKINEAQKYAESYAQNSNNRKQDTETDLSPKKSKPGAEGSKETNTPHQPVEDLTTKTTTEETAGQKDTNPSQPLQDVTTKPTSEDTKEQKDTNPSQLLQDVTTKPTSKSKKERKDTNPVQYVEKSAKSPGIKGNVSPYDTNSDGAITASFSLLLALIACTALN